MTKGKIIIYVILAVALAAISGWLFWYEAARAPSDMSEAQVPKEQKDTRRATNNPGIKVYAPEEEEIISSPLSVSGEARGSWFFEASFPVRILDADGAVLGAGAARALGEWMTEEFVPFKAIIKFSSPRFATGTVVLEKDNPSGLPENAADVRIPVVFASSTILSSQETGAPTSTVQTPGGKCFIGGCSGQICSDTEDAVSTCDYQPQYVCYKTAKCERQTNGACGWTPTPLLQACLKNPPGNHVEQVF